MCNGIPVKYSVQTCITPMQAQLRMLRTHHQLMVKCSVHMCRKKQCKHWCADTCCVWWLLTERTWSEIKHQLTINMLRIPDHQSLLHLMITSVHWNHNICAQLPVQRSDVHHLNASTSAYAQKHQLMLLGCTSQLTKHCII